MSLIAKDESNFKPCPEGLHPAVCCDVIDLGLMESSFKAGLKQQKCRIVWQTEEVNPDTGKPFLIRRMYTVSLNEKASLRKDLEGWRGRKFTGEELKGFDLEKLIGVPCQLNVVHQERDGKTYGNVQTVVPLGKGMEKPVIRDYVREQDRSPEEREAHEPTTDDDVPF